ncbi:MAG: hypothetical protein M0P38_06400 [Bacteroidales bacterium]|nr:hypothetical protein [Bacteroidales bacterium]
MVEEAKLKESIADGSKEFKNRITESQNEEDSLRSKAALLSQLKQQYESLSESERNNSAVGGELRQQMSARAFDRILKVARTIADLNHAPEIHIDHLSEAINFRSLDRDNWGK